MPRPCTICQHPDLAAINELLAAKSASYRAIGRQFNVGRDALSKHDKEHLPAHLTKAHRAEETADATGLLQKVEGLEIEARHLLGLAKRKAEAKEAGARELQAAAALLREVRSTLELLGKVSGELIERHQHAHRQAHEHRHEVIDFTDPENLFNAGAALAERAGILDEQQRRELVARLLAAPAPGDAEVLELTEDAPQDAEVLETAGEMVP